MYVCVMDRQGKKLVHTNVKDNDFAFFLKLVQPYKHSLTVCCECMFGWYWLADACLEAGLSFVLAHALYVRAIHGGKNKNDRIDSEKQYDTPISALELDLLRVTKECAGRDYALLQSVPGIGRSLGLTILYEIGSIDRFPTVKDFLSYCRLVKGTVASAGKIKGLRGAKLGNPYLRWAFGEAAVIAKRDHAIIGPLAQRLEAQMKGNKFKANTVLAIKLARAVYFMLKNKTVFDPERLVAVLAKN
jgi:transposase